jgi:hypothetical protein
VFQLSVATAQATMQPEMLPVEALFRLTNFTVGKQSFLLVVPPENTGTQDDSVSGQSLAALLNFFLEIPAPAEK